MPPATWQLYPDLDAPGPLSRAQLAAFYNDGFLMLPEFFCHEQLEAVQTDTETVISELAERLYAGGKISQLHRGLDWTSRLLRMKEEFSGAPVCLIKGGVLPAALQRMFCHPEILEVAEQLGIGGEIAVNPAWNLRGKMPGHEETVVPWHQDNSYWEPRIWDERVLTFWVALVDATVENGCMQMIRGGHRSGRTGTHTIGTTTSTWYTEMDEQTAARELLGKPQLEGGDVVTLPAKAGSVLVFPGTSPHRSLNSISDNIRWSVDFRLHPKSAARSGESELDWFYGLKDSLVVSGGKEPSWDQWAAVDRTALQDHKMQVQDAGDQFDQVIVGPWMDLWDLETHARDCTPNIHIQRYLAGSTQTVSYTHLRAHETPEHLVCRLLLEKKKKKS
eukprot:TRINITY_DN13954_c0_g1_i3.p1 TRINITY_DN13954_c0_g1~~TRINITY_DN13954_c0_g1_i3.p1  ORF type:complete len:390 (-),score=92.31 TRINITY_DN13954_c0_g1_i3:83-1252(-)